MTFRTFNSEKELFDFQAERAEKGHAALKVWQRDLGMGAFAFRMIVNQARAPWTMFFCVTGGPQIDTDGKIIGVIASYNRDVRCYSELDPGGRSQTIDVGDIWGVIDAALFEEAKALGWLLPPVLRTHFDFVFTRHADIQKKTAANLAAIQVRKP